MSNVLKNIKCELSYDGKGFNGFQIQPNQRTVQGEIINSIYKLTGEKVNIFASGRTDAGVHARKQVFNFQTESNIPAERWKNALNSIIPDDILILNSIEVPMSFHSRYDVKQKTYRYYINNNKEQNIFRRNYTWFYPHSLNLEEMNSASKLFIGEHDFTSFSSAKTEIEDKTRIIYESSLWEENGEIVYQITGNGFLYNMVRIIIGTLVEVGSNKINKNDIIEIFQNKNRETAGKTAPAQGLVLWDVKY